MEIILGLQALLSATLRMATPLILTAIGETYAERSGVINIGLEGLMLIGAFTAYAVVFYTSNLILGVLLAALAAAVFGLAFAFTTITLKANQIIMGVALNMIGAGVTGLLYRTIFAQTNLASAVKTFVLVPIPLLSRIPFIGEVLFNQNYLVYATYLLVPLAAIVMSKTSFGLAIRAVGEHPRAVDSLGLQVSFLRYVAVVLGAVLAGVGGAYLSIAHANQFVEGMSAGRGFIALAMVAFGAWQPLRVWLAGLLFGAAFALQLRLQAAHINVAYQFLQILPYVVTSLALIFARRQSIQPKALGVPYEASL